MLSTTLLALSFLPATFAHFKLKYPTSRGFDDDKEGTFPCGGFDTVQSERTNFPISGGPIQINLGHPQTNVAVYMAIGDDPGSAFSIKMQPNTMITGLGDFCFGSVSVPAGLNVTEGTKASIQVVTNNHESGGLFQASHQCCADVTLVNTPLSSSDYSNNCKNASTSVTQENISGNPNETSSGETGGSASGSGSAAAASPTASPAAASQAKAVSWVLGAVGLAGMALL
ncbi:predicted protein [Plenodomus lingam JN3]|uniref:Predicted protein n=1 Tax=Leptosphaeria maculans (strain JN3 / isolate v23.1.3 / race Av1-4-5-6-7-8) TaxID=985895 RepID=E4ZPN5_LEPMJ|nr:predicted protein [Plenodomus lingam JN3]CBX93420.1 predicted protein [Plenodomus lingam JN3]